MDIFGYFVSGSFSVHYPELNQCRGLEFQQVLFWNAVGAVCTAGAGSVRYTAAAATSFRSISKRSWGCGVAACTALIRFAPGACKSKVIAEGRLINASDNSESALQRLHLQLNSQNGANVRRKSSLFLSIVKEHRHNSHWRAGFNGHPTVRKAQRHHQQCAAEN
jgi:hypothetical protein